MPTLFEAGVNVLLLLLILSAFQALLGGFVLVGGGVSIHFMHAVNTLPPLSPGVYDEEIPLQILLVLLRGPFEFSLPSTHGATCVYVGVITHMHEGEGLACNVGDPITDIVVTRRDEASLLAVEGMVDGKCRTVSIEKFQKVRWIDAIVQ